MSLRRHDLERSSDKLRLDLEHLQQVSSEQGDQISSSLQALRREQQVTNKLLNSGNWTAQEVDSQDRGKTMLLEGQVKKGVDYTGNCASNEFYVKKNSAT